MTDLIYEGKGQIFCRKVNTSNASVGGRRGGVFDLSFKKMPTCDTPCPMHPLLFLIHRPHKLISLSSFASSVIAKCKASDMKKRKNTTHTCCLDFISTLFLPLLPFISENKINERRTFRAPVLPSPPSSSPYDKGFH